MFERVRTFEKIVVHPTQELPIPSADSYRGGPAWPHFGRQVLARHCWGAIPIPVDFEPEDVCRTDGERSGQRAAAGPDFKKRLVSRRRNRGNQLVDPGALEKMLTESLPGEWPALNREVVTG